MYEIETKSGDIRAADIARVVSNGERGIQTVERHYWSDDSFAEHRRFVADADVIEITKDYRAFNGHTMVYYVDLESLQLQRGHSFEAWCADDCAACAAGEPLPDW